MLIQKAPVEELFEFAESQHENGEPFWRIFVRTSMFSSRVTAGPIATASEYEMYFNWILARPKWRRQIAFRHLNFVNTGAFDGDRKVLEDSRLFHFAAYHHGLRSRMRIEALVAAQRELSETRRE